LKNVNLIIVAAAVLVLVGAQWGDHLNAFDQEATASDGSVSSSVLDDLKDRSIRLTQEIASGEAPYKVGWGTTTPPEKMYEVIRTQQICHAAEAECTVNWDDIKTSTETVDGQLFVEVTLDWNIDQATRTRIYQECTNGSDVELMNRLLDHKSTFVYRYCQVDGKWIR